MAFYYTHLLVEYPSDINIDFNKNKFNIDIEISKFTETIKMICVKSMDLSEEVFEAERDKFILLLSKMNFYVSILFDNISAERHKIISDSIYDLERKFRNLIEIVFLDNIKKGKTIDDLPIYEKLNSKDKKIGREEVVQALQNPLDDLDFIKLKEFVNENMALDSNGTIINKLDLLFYKFEKLTSLMDNEKKVNEIYNDIKELKNEILTRNEKALSASNIFSHLTVSISDEWSKLYKIRNLWAHNNCIITKNEFDEYNKLNKIVLSKIETEFTLMTFFGKKTESDSIVLFESEDGYKRLAIKRYEIYGRGNCKLEFIIYENNHSAVLEQDDFIYKDFNGWFKVLGLEELIMYNSNPLLLFNSLNIKNKFCNKLKELNIQKLKQIYEKIKVLNENIKFNSNNGNACIVSKEVEENLKVIFTD